jgi:hypothetical protein
VDDHVGSAQGLAAAVVEPESVAADVAGHGPHPPLDLGGKVVAEFASEAVEAVVLDDLPGQPGRGVRTPPGSDQHGDLGLWDAAQDPLDQGRPEEAGGSGDEESLPTEIPLDGHQKCLPPGTRFCLPFGKCPARRPRIASSTPP